TMKVAARRREDPLPHPFPACMRILSRERRGQLDSTGAGAEIGLVQMAHADEVPRERGLRGRGEDGQAIPISLPTANGDLAAPEVDVLHPEPGAFEQAEAGAVEQRRREPVNTLQLADHDADFVGGEYEGEAGGGGGAIELVEVRQVGVEHVEVEAE